MNTNLESRLAELNLPVPSGLAERALRAAAAPEVVAVPSRHRAGSRRFAVGGVTMAVILATLALAAVVDGSGHVPTANADEILSKAQRAGSRLGLADLGSPGGTFIDGARLLPEHGPRDISAARAIRLGSVELALSRT